MNKNSSEQEKDYSFEGRIEKSVPQDHRLSSLASLVMPNGDPRDGFFYPTLTLRIDSYITCLAGKYRGRWADGSVGGTVCGYWSVVRSLGTCRYTGRWVGR